VSTDLQTALEELNRQFDIPLEELVHALESGIANAYRRAFEPEGEVEVTIDPATGAVSGRLRTRRPDGGVDVEEVPGDEFRRLAPQAARHLVLRQLRELEREQVMREGTEHRGELVSGTVDRNAGGVVHIDLGKAEGLLGPEDRVPGEVLVPGRPVTVVILEARRAGATAVLRVSRAHRLFVQRLLEREVPEIRSGAVQVKGIAREPGLRTKVAVAATEPGLDPVGACIGPRGVRHRAILAELGAEHVDVVEWFDDPAQFIARALGPAQVTSVELEAGAGTAHVHVPASQLSLAIGRDGQNARLAAKLTGWRIDIRADEDPAAA
jgi:N utilization substance protein A